MTSSARRWPPVFLLAALLVLCTATSPAPAAGAHARLLHISANAPFFHGRIVTTDVCDTDRNVKVFKQRAGSDQLLGSALTDSTGHWSVPSSPSPGAYYAKTHRFYNTSEAVRCKRSKSRTIVLD